METVGSFEAKTHLSRLLERVAQGERITITRHGVPVARLVPVEPAQSADRAAAIDELQRFRAGRRLGNASIREWIEEGRRVLTPLVLDCSVTMAWCFEDEGGPYAEAVLERLNTRPALVPAIWPLEVANVLLVAERRQRLSQADGSRFLALVRSLPITIDETPVTDVIDAVLSLGRQQQLSAYDATYVELALRRGAELATLDGRLRSAARALGIGIVGE